MIKLLASDGVRFASGQIVAVKRRQECGVGEEITAD